MKLTPLINLHYKSLHIYIYIYVCIYSLLQKIELSSNLNKIPWLTEY